LAGIELFKNKKKKWQFRIKAYNGKILAHSEAYSSKRNCKIGAEACETVIEDNYIDTQEHDAWSN
jgi:hypothetical protein